jgi:dynein heavy chain
MSNLLSTTTSVSGNGGINFEVIRYMICQVQYGGRITDEMDRGLFDTFGALYLRENIFNPEAALVDFTVDTGVRDAKGPIKDRVRYIIPNSTEIQRYREYVDSLPDIDSPEVFGLHPNADITFRLKESNEMIDVIMETRPKEGGTGNSKGRDEVVYE